MYIVALMDSGRIFAACTLINFWGEGGERGCITLTCFICYVIGQACYSVYVCGSQTWRLRVSEDSEQFSMEMAGGSEVNRVLSIKRMFIAISKPLYMYTYIARHQFRPNFIYYFFLSHCGCFQNHCGFCKGFVTLSARKTCTL